MFTSCLVSTTFIPIFSAAARIGEICPPANVKMCLMLWASKTLATISPPLRFDVVSTYTDTHIAT
jgi:hypothetical protein